jgi:polar amino acid transport system substrate-binding protein
MRGMVRAAAALLLAGTLTGATPGAGRAQEVSPAARQELAPTGALRFGVLAGARTFAVGADLGQELARRLGVPFMPVAYPTATAALDGARAGQVDALYVPVDPTRAAEFDFAAPYLVVDMTYIVPAGSPIRTAADADRPGVRVAAPLGSVYHLALEQELRAAELVPMVRLDAFAAMEAGTLHALAYERPTLVADATERPGFRVVDGRFGVTEHAVAVPKGRAAALTLVTQVVDAAKATGLVQQWVAQLGPPGALGVQVPPPARGVRLPATGAPTGPPLPHIAAAAALMLLGLLGTGRAVARRATT